MILDACLWLAALLLGWLSGPPPAPRPTVVRYGPFLSPHPHHTPVYHVDAPDVERALRALLETAA